MEGASVSQGETQGIEWTRILLMDGVAPAGRIHPSRQNSPLLRQNSVVGTAFFPFTFSLGPTAN